MVEKNNGGVVGFASSLYMLDMVNIEMVSSYYLIFISLYYDNID